MSSPLAPLLTCILVVMQCLDQLQGKAIHSFAGPYIGFGHYISNCPAMDHVTFRWRLSHYNRAKPNEPQRLTGNITSKHDVMGGLLTQVDMSIWANNQWKENAFIFRFPNQGCTALRDQFPNMFRLIKKRHNDSERMSMDKNVPCVVPKGFAVFEDDPIEWTFPNFPVIPYGRYRFRVTAYHPHDEGSKLPSFCIFADCEVIPKTF